MKDAFVLVITSILLFACTGPATAQEIELSPEMQVWKPILGNWSYENEVRESPDSAWKKQSLTQEVRSGGFFLDMRWTDDTEGQETFSSIEIVGYDPVQNCNFSHFFRSDGSRGSVTSAGWDGTTVNVNWTFTSADGEVVLTGRNAWEYSPDFKSATLTGEVFTDGKWWTARKGKGTRVE